MIEMMYSNTRNKVHATPRYTRPQLEPQITTLDKCKIY